MDDLITTTLSFLSTIFIYVIPAFAAVLALTFIVLGIWKDRKHLHALWIWLGPKGRKAVIIAICIVFLVVPLNTWWQLRESKRSAPLARLQEQGTILAPRSRVSFSVSALADFSGVPTDSFERWEQTVASPTVVVPQRGGPWDGVKEIETSASLRLPAGATNVQHRAWWTNTSHSDGNSAAVSIDGDNVTATGKLRGDKRNWGARVWGELNLNVMCTFPVTVTKPVTNLTIATNERSKDGIVIVALPVQNGSLTSATVHVTLDGVSTPITFTLTAPQTQAQASGFLVTIAGSQLVISSVKPD
jgi:hypothetical protein